MSEPSIKTAEELMAVIRGTSEEVWGAYTLGLRHGRDRGVFGLLAELAANGVISQEVAAILTAAHRDAFQDADEAFYAAQGRDVPAAH